MKVIFCLSLCFEKCIANITIIIAYSTIIPSIPQGAGKPFPNAVELPVCAVCLEKMVHLLFQHSILYLSFFTFIFFFFLYFLQTSGFIIFLFFCLRHFHLTFTTFHLPSFHHLSTICILSSITHLPRMNRLKAF